ncbi:MAG: amidohydrolase family protein [Caldilineaceae bacterium]
MNRESAINPQITTDVFDGATAAQIAAPAWHLHATILPDGDRREEWWIVDGCWSRTPVAGAVDLPGAWLLPGGLVDAHVHLGMDFNNMGLALGSEVLMAANLATQQRAGVLALRDAGLLPGARLDPVACRGRVIAAGPMMAPAGRFHPGLYTPVAPEALVATALATVAGGAPWVKVIADFPGPDGNWFAPIVNYPPELLATLVRAVHAVGARVMAHVSGPIVPALVAAGIDSIEHGPLVTPDVVRMMADRGTAWTPTLWTVTKYMEPLTALSGPMGEQVRHTFVQWQETLSLAVALGVHVLAGSDEAPHGSLWQEIATLARFGLSPRAALAAASTQARAYLGLPTIQTGIPANFTLYAQDPRQDLPCLAKPLVVMQEGRLR